MFLVLSPSSIRGRELYVYFVMVFGGGDRVKMTMGAVWLL